ncbi:MAG: ribosome assembly RNA-binding protein YhbY [Clostridia bacterium]|nr:ribosome assembly RNA-binding protein YhbY [Clostridia bacterium]
MLNSKQRAFLRALSHGQSAIFQVGKGGIGEELCLGIDSALTARELIKVHVLENSPYTAREAADLLSERTGADVVSVVGSKLVLYRESAEKKQIELP